MFDQIKALGSLAGLMKDKERLRGIAERFREKIDAIRVVGAGGGGAVRVTMSGQMRVMDVALDPALVAGLGVGAGGGAMAQALIRDAINDAVAQAQALVRSEADRQARELGLPGVGGMGGLEGLMGGGKGSFPSGAG